MFYDFDLFCVDFCDLYCNDDHLNKKENLCLFLLFYTTFYNVVFFIQTTLGTFVNSRRTI